MNTTKSLTFLQYLNESSNHDVLTLLSAGLITGADYLKYLYDSGQSVDDSIDNLLASDLITCSDYFDYLIYTDINPIHWFWKNVALVFNCRFPLDKIDANRITIIFKNKFYSLDERNTSKIRKTTSSFCKSVNCKFYSYGNVDHGLDIIHYKG